MLGAANAIGLEGTGLGQGTQTWFLSTTDQLFKAKDYRPPVVAYRNGAPVRLGDVAQVTDRSRTCGPAASTILSPPCC